MDTIVEKIRFYNFHVDFKLHGEGHSTLFNNSTEISSTCCQNIIKFVKSIRNFGRNCGFNVLYNTPILKRHDKMSTRHSFGGELQQNESWKLGLENKLDKMCCYKSGKMPLSLITIYDTLQGLKTTLRNGQYLNKFYVYKDLCTSSWKQLKRDRVRACDCSTTEVWPSMFQLLPHSYTLTHACALGLEDYGYYSVDKGSAAHEEGLGFGTLEPT